MRRARWRTVTWVVGLLVVAGAGVLTAHGLYEVARSAGVPPAMAAGYPLITDGLALLAYAGTRLLGAGGRRYAAVVMVLSAGLSGLAQAVYLAGGVGTAAPVAVRFGVGAWPAVAAIVAAHLVHLMAERPAELEDQADGPADFIPAAIPGQARPAGGPDRANGPAGELARAVPVVEDQARPTGQTADRARAGWDVEDTRSPRERARDWAALRQLATGELPTVREVATGASVGRETAGKALQELRVGSNGHSSEPAPVLVKP